MSVIPPVPRYVTLEGVFRQSTLQISVCGAETRLEFVEAKICGAYASNPLYSFLYFHFTYIYARF